MMPSLDLRAADPEVEIRRPEARDKECTPWRIYLREKEFEEFGRTAGCVSRRCAVPLGRGSPGSEGRGVDGVGAAGVRRGGLGGVYLCWWRETHRRTLDGRGQGLRSPQEQAEGLSRGWMPWRRLYAVPPPLELVQFFLSTAAASSKRGNARKVMLFDIGKAHFHAPIEGEQHVGLARERARW